MHVHDPETSVLEIGLWDKGEEGAIPLSMTGVFRGPGGKELVGTARVPLSKVCRLFRLAENSPFGRKQLKVVGILCLALVLESLVRAS